MSFDPRVIKQSIENLKLLHPSLMEDEEAWIATLESETNLDALLTSIVRRIEDTKALVIGTKDRSEELKSRKDRFEHRVDALRGLLFKMMEAAGLDKRELPEATLSIRKGQPQLLEWGTDPEKLPDELCKISRSPDRTAIKDALKDGVTVPGFSLSSAQPSLSIRIK